MLDSRELQSRLTELEDMAEAYRESVGTSMPEAPLDDDEQRELEELTTLADEVSEWYHGATLIPEDEFEEYARQLADDIGATNSDHGWPLTHIDWEAASEALKQDYSEVTYNGRTYLVRD